MKESRFHRGQAFLLRIVLYALLLLITYLVLRGFFSFN